MPSSVLFEVFAALEDRIRLRQVWVECLGLLKQSHRLVVVSIHNALLCDLHAPLRFVSVALHPLTTGADSVYMKRFELQEEEEEECWDNSNFRMLVSLLFSSISPSNQLSLA